MIDIGRVFSNTLKMARQHWLIMIGLWAVFFGVQIIYSSVLGALLGGAAMAAVGSGLDPATLDNPMAVGGLGVVTAVFFLLFYIGYFALVFGQQGAMVAMASPIESINFGEAFGRGLKGGLTALGVMILFLVIGLILGLLAAVAIALVASIGEAGAAILIVLMAPVVIYLMLRFAVLIPVIVVEQVYNPISALRRTWSATSGKVLGVLVVYLAFTLIAVVVVGVPAALLFGSAIFAIEGGGADPSSFLGTFALAILFFFAVAIVFTILSSTLLASLHAEVSDTQELDLSKTFE